LWFALVLISYLSVSSNYAKFRSRSHDAVIRVYDDAGNVIETHGHAGKFLSGDGEEASALEGIP
jgi:hypothetical protein